MTLTQPVERLQRRFPRVSLSLSTGGTRDLLERVRARALDGAVILLPDDERMPAGVGGADTEKCIALMRNFIGSR
jgi:DNA-binding transcriptional LysR family regulator